MFINRQKEVLFLQSDFNSIIDGSRCLILCAPTGFGKSELVNKSFKNKDNFIRVKVANHEGAKNISCLHIKELGRSLNQAALEKGAFLSFEDFLKRNERDFKSVIKKIAGDFVENNKYIPSKEMGRIIKKGIDTPNWTDAIFLSDHNEAFSEVCAYIKQTFENDEFIIAVENIQNIDNESLMFFRDLLITSKSLYLIGEYTEMQNFQIYKTDLLNYFTGPCITPQLKQLDKLLLKDIINECIDKPTLLTSILQDSYQQSSGNLHNLQILFSDQFLESLQFNKSTFQYDEIISRELNNLSPDESFILASIVSHAGKVDKEIFARFFNNNSIIYNVAEIGSTSDLIKRLVNKKLITVSDYSFDTAQDSIIEEVLTNASFTKYILVSSKSWLSFYQSIKTRGDDLLLPISEIISWEIFFKAALEDFTGMKSLLDEVYNLTLLSTVPKRAIRYLELIKKSLDKGTFIKNKEEVGLRIDLKIIQILFRLWYFEEIPKFSSNHLDRPIILLFHISALSLIGRTDEAIELSTKFIENPKTINDYRLSAYIIRLSAYRASNQYDTCESEWKRLHVLEIFKNTRFEALFLRSSDFALLNDCENQIQYLRDSINFFVESQQTLNEISARNALAQQLGYLGYLEETENELKIANQKAGSIFIKHYAIDNNFCTLDLQRGKASNKIIKKLKETALTCETILDHFIILINLFIAQSMHNLKYESELTLRAIDQKIFSNEIEDYDLKRIALYNAYTHYKKTNNVDLALHYLSKAKELPVLADKEFWEIKLKGRLPYDYDDFRLTLDYYPVYITYWHFDFDSVLNSSQLEAE